MSQCIAFEIVNNKTVRCVNIVANGDDWVCSLPECQRMNSKTIKSDRAVVVALHNIIYNDNDNVESDTNELCAAMELLPMIRESKRELTGTHIRGPIIEATDGVASNTDPAGALKRMPSNSKGD
jgi:hypothetical protein